MDQKQDKHNAQPAGQEPRRRQRISYQSSRGENNSTQVSRYSFKNNEDNHREGEYRRNSYNNRTQSKPNYNNRNYQNNNDYYSAVQSSETYIPKTAGRLNDRRQNHHSHNANYNNNNYGNSNYSNEYYNDDFNRNNFNRNDNYNRNTTPYNNRNTSRNNRNQGSNQTNTFNRKNEAQANQHHNGHAPANKKAQNKPQQQHFVPQPQFVDYSQPMRLNKFMSNAGICSRREADEYIQAGVVSVNGVIVTELGTRIIPASDKVLFHDQPIRAERKVYILLNKPKNCITSVEDPHAKLTVLDFVKDACRQRIYPVGRLDRNTTGVLLLTNDGDLTTKLTHPRFNKKKIYQVTTDRDLTPEVLQRLRDGFELEDGPIKVDAIEFVSDDDPRTVGVEIHSGRNRIVRRIFDAVGYRVAKLDRVEFAGLTKKGLGRGKWRFLTETEVGILKMTAASFRIDE